MTTPTDISAEQLRLLNEQWSHAKVISVEGTHYASNALLTQFKNFANTLAAQNADLRREVERQSLVDGFTIHNASPVFAGKNIAFAFDRLTAELIAEYGNKQSKYQSDIRTAWIRHAAQPHMTWFWKDAPAPEQSK